MSALLRAGVAFVAGVATFYVVGWLGAAVLTVVAPQGLAFTVAFLSSAVLAALVARHVWRWSGAASQRVGVHVVYLKAVGLGIAVGILVAIVPKVASPTLVQLVETDAAGPGVPLALAVLNWSTRLAAPLMAVLPGVLAGVLWVTRQFRPRSTAESPIEVRRLLVVWASLEAGSTLLFLTSDMWSSVALSVWQITIAVGISVPAMVGVVVYLLKANAQQSSTRILGVAAVVLAMVGFAFVLAPWVYIRTAPAGASTEGLS